MIVTVKVNVPPAYFQWDQIHHPYQEEEYNFNKQSFTDNIHVAVKKQ
jgi:hypothetical protein